jgi:signal transduction histidine kinase/ActR/RegA family two-component response regulator
MLGMLHFVLSIGNYLNWADITSYFEEYEEFIEFLFILMAFLVLYQLYLESFHQEIFLSNCKLIQEQKKMATILMDLSEAVIIIDIYGNIEFINKKVEEILQIKSNEAIQRKIDEIFLIYREKNNQINRIYTEDPYIQEISNNKFKSSFDENYFIYFPSSQDTPKIQILFNGITIFEENNNPIGGLIVIQDITEQKRIEKMLIETERIQSITLLARGLAHDFNNILTAIIGNAGLLKEINHIDKEGQEFIEEIEYSTLRAKGITAQLATLARNKRDIKKKKFNLSKLVKESTTFSLRGTNISPEFIFDVNCYIKGNENDLSRVFQNLAINSMQAMPHGGSIIVRIRNPTIQMLSPELVENVQYIQISVEDHGEGIPKEKIEQIFNLFYTTKVQGSGLGLAIAKNIINMHDGFIYVNSTVGEGTIFTVLLPRLEIFDNQVEISYKTQEKFDGKILLLEDNEQVSKVLKKMLVLLGFTVDLTDKGKDAIQHYKIAMENNDPYYATILDFVIQGDNLNGVDVFQTIKKLDSSAFTIISSGSIEFTAIDETLRLDQIHYLYKPYLISDLREILSKKDTIDF